MLRRIVFQCNLSVGIWPGRAMEGEGERRSEITQQYPFEIGTKKRRGLNSNNDSKKEESASCRIEKLKRSFESMFCNYK